MIFVSWVQTFVMPFYMKPAKKHGIRAGPVFGAKHDKLFIVVRYLYGLKLAIASFQ